MKMISFTSSPSYILRSSKNKKPAVASPRLPASSLTVLLFGQRFLARVLRKPASVLQPRLLVVTRDGVERRLCHRLLHHVLARDLYLAVILHAGAGRNQAAHDHVLLQAAQVVHLAVDRSFGEYARRLLEGGRRDERIRRQRRLRDTQQLRLALRRTSAGFERLVVFHAELELVDNFFRQELGVADVLDLHPP